MGRKKQPTCQRGHPFTPENVKIGSNGHRRCKTCFEMRRKVYRLSAKGQATERLYRSTPRHKMYQALWWQSENGKQFDHDRKKLSRAAAFERLATIKMATGCVDCGFKGHPAALQFDHVRGQKFKNISMMYDSAWDDVEAEIAKCEVRCANCHAIVTFNRRRGNS